MEETMKISTEDIRIYAKALRLSNLRNNCERYNPQSTDRQALISGLHYGHP